MKEFDYTKWDNKPREMWVWDGDKDGRVKRLVTFISDEVNIESKVLAVDTQNSFSSWWTHCAEIEWARRMTNYGLAHWLWEGSHKGEFRQYITFYNSEEDHGVIDAHYDYVFADDREIDKDIKIRVNGGEWKEPLIEE